ncbi:MAG: hypothetical protein M5U12_13705 [Verrucomicrobia bacterium]|nr:hypothetical protein [Verrucomicrobiota bacterium]
MSSLCAPSAPTTGWSRREFLHRVTGAGAALVGGQTAALLAQERGERPEAVPGLEVLLPRERIPVSFIIDDSTCLVNLNKFAIPQFAAAHPGGGAYTRYDWRAWPDEIPDDFVRKFGEWCGAHGVKGKYSVVPYPACVGRLDGELPGWTPREVEASIDLVRDLLLSHWDIHPEMVTHTRVIDLRTGHPHPERSLRFMENWDWTTGRSVDEIAAYQAYALRILKNVGLPCEGITTPGGYGNRARPQLAQATLESVRDVFGAEIPHYFRDAYAEGPQSVAPRVEYAAGLAGADPRCVVSIVACTGDWTGGWDNTEPGGADKFITADGRQGRLVEVIERGEPACLLAHWTGIWFNGQEAGFRIFQEVVRRLHARFDHLLWMKLSELARYWAARELTQVRRTERGLTLQAPFAAPAFTLRLDAPANAAPRVGQANRLTPLREVASARQIEAGTWRREGSEVVVCFDLSRGENRLQFETIPDP